MIRQFTEKDKNSSQTYDKILNLINKETHKTWQDVHGFSSAIFKKLSIIL